jgi:phosphomannomutase/phosphoglucomutase
MGSLAKLLLSLGSKGSSIAAIVMSCVVVMAGFLWQQQTSDQEYKEIQVASNTIVANMIESYTQSRILTLKKQVEVIAQSKQIIDSLAFNDSSLIEIQQQDLLSFFPNARSLCLINAAVDEVSQRGCMPISFATLNSLRQAKKEGSAQFSVMKAGSEEAYLLLAQRISNQSGKVLGVLVVTLSADVIPSLIYKSANLKGYLELQQGSKTTTVLASSGDPALKQGLPMLNNKVPSTYWRIAFWPTPISNQVPTYEVIAGVLALMILFWLLLELVKGFIVKRDAAILRAQLVDFKSGSLKPRYHVTLAPFNKVVDDILNLGREQYQNTAKKGATAESIGKKIEQVENSSRTTPVQSESVKEIINIDPSIFRANDIRGIVGQSIDEQVFTALGQAIGSEAINQGVNKLVVGRDARLTSLGLSKSLISGVISSGCDVVDIGEIPTPLMYFACEQLNTHSGIMVTGGHNPPDYNGLKVVMGSKFLENPGLQQLNQRILNDELKSGKGTLSEESITYDYVSRIVGDIKINRPLKVAIDCGNGVSGSIAPALFKALGCEVIELFCDVDGKFPNHHPNPGELENLKDLSAAVVENKAELGIAFDGDGDRLGVVDSNGDVIFPDQLLMMFSLDLLSRKPGSTILYDVKCSNLLGSEIVKAGGVPMMSKPGHSLIKNKMLETGADLAGEFSGHIFFKERWYGFDDALYATARLLEIIANDSLSRNVLKIFTDLPKRESTPEIYVKMADDESNAFMRQLSGEGKFEGAELTIIDGIRAEYLNGWGLVRASNTMPGLKLRFEADSSEDLEDIQQRFKDQMLQVKPTLKLLF